MKLLKSVVTSLAEVWIEIWGMGVAVWVYQSLPLRKCGLKSKASGISILSTAVTSLAEVWIEIRRNWHSGWKKEVTSLAEVWIEILNKNVTAPIAAGHFPCGSVDWNIFRLLSRYPSHSHFPCGSVDWNTEHIVLSCWLLKVTSLAEVWIEIRYNPGTYWIWLCHFPCGSVDWNHHIFYIGIAHVVTSLAEVWIEILYLLTNQCSILSLPLRKCGLKYGFLCIQWSNEQVTSLAEVWIEIGFGIIRTRTFAVTSLAEVWIEISSSVAVQSMSWPSLPLRKCGLKWLKMFCTFVLCWVTSLAEVWIEIWSSVKSRRVQGVTSLAEVWIEITLLRGWRNDERSLPLRKCGLKCPFETTLYGVTSHFPCGSVDWNIFNNLRQKIKNLSLPLRKCGLKWNTCWSPWLLSLSLPLRKCGLKFASVPDLIYSYGRHFPCGSVDWNSHKAGLHDHPDVTSLAEVWIEISLLPPKT